jgi:hypothetical protein
MIEWQPILLAMVSGAFYSLYWYLNKVADPTSPTKIENIDVFAIIATISTGAIVGVYTVLSGGELTQVSIEIQLMSYVAITAVIERGLKTGVRILKEKGVL